MIQKSIKRKFAKKEFIILRITTAIFKAKVQIRIKKTIVAKAQKIKFAYTLQGLSRRYLARKKFLKNKNHVLNLQKSNFLIKL